MSNIQTLLEKADLPQSEEDGSALKKPSWLKVRLPSHDNFFQLRELVKKNRLHTICQSARCPNIAECWQAGTATFLILGGTCTRDCGFCAVPKGKPLPLAADEPQRVAEAASVLGLNYVVVTSVTRDDLPDGGASVFAKTIQAVRAARPGVKIEVLIPDFGGDPKALAAVLEARPDVLNHNLETAESCYPLIRRPRENYRRSLGLLETASQMGALTKSGLMVGLGEAAAEVDSTLIDLRAAGCNLLTVGQYLRPARENVPVRKYYTPREFADLKTRALELGFDEVAAGPLVRSSYQAHRLYAATGKGASKQPCAI